MVALIDAPKAEQNWIVQVFLQKFLQQVIFMFLVTPKTNCLQI